MKYIPDDKQMEELLQNLVPETSRRLNARLATAPWTPRAVAHRRFLNATVAAVLTLALLVAITPQGQAFAQSILRFFVHTESDTRAVPTLAPVVTVLSSNDSTAPTPMPDTRLPFEETCGSLLPHCTLAEISDVTFLSKSWRSI
jgi:hypothetical protein